jgi:hypothetical protein
MNVTGWLGLSSGEEKELDATRAVPSMDRQPPTRAKARERLIWIMEL